MFKAERCSVLLGWKTTGGKNRGRFVRKIKERGSGVVKGGEEVWTIDKEARGRVRRKQRCMQTDL